MTNKRFPHYWPFVRGIFRWILLTNSRNAELWYFLYCLDSVLNKRSSLRWHYNDVIMTTMASQITSLTVVYSTVYSDADQRKHQSSASLAFVRGIHRDRWIPRTKGQLRGKCFHLMTSSWFETPPRLCHVAVMIWAKCGLGDRLGRKRCFFVQPNSLDNIPRTHTHWARNKMADI